MSTRQNRFGLTRASLKAEDRRAVRQRCGFGCIICGFAFCEYHHHDPPFESARFHDRSGIHLLCKRCHGEFTCGRYSKEFIDEAAARPFCLSKQSPVYPLLDVGRGPLRVQIGNVVLCNPRVAIAVYGEPVLSISSGEHSNLSISASVRNQNGEQIFVIEENTVYISNLSWDIETTGKQICLRSGPGVIDLRLRFYPREQVVIDRLSMSHLDCQLECRANGSIRVTQGNRSFECRESTYLTNCDTGIDVSRDGINVGINCLKANIKQAKLRS